MAVRVLFADDQLPWNDPEQDARVKSEIAREKGDDLRALGKDPGEAYEADRRWFGELLHRLEFDFGFEVTREREFSAAMRAAERPQAFDVAVIDLSWSGDGCLEAGKRSNVGLKLIDVIDPRRSGIPVIAFSQNFDFQRDLMRTVTDRGAFPLQKWYSEIDYLALGAAITYLTREIRQEEPAGTSPTAPVAGKSTGSSFWDVVQGLPRAYLMILLPLALLLILALAHLNTAPGQMVTVLGLPLYSRGP